MTKAECRDAMVRAGALASDVQSDRVDVTKLAGVVVGVVNVLARYLDAAPATVVDAPVIPITSAKRATRGKK